MAALDNCTTSTEGVGRRFTAPGAALGGLTSFYDVPLFEIIMSLSPVIACSQMGHRFGRQEVKGLFTALSEHQIEL